MNYHAKMSRLDHEPAPLPESFYSMSGISSVLTDGTAGDLLELNRFSVDEELWLESLLGPARSFLSKPGKSLRKTFVQLGWELALRAKDAQETALLDPLASRDIKAQGHPIQLSCLVELLHAGSLIIDDIEDDSTLRRGAPCLHREVGLARALNVGNWLYFVAISLIDQLDCDLTIKASLYQAVLRVMLRCHQGQALDVTHDVTGLERGDVRRLTELSTSLKSGALVGLSIQLSGIYLGLSESECQSLYRFGESLGTCLQMYDDYSSIALPQKYHKGYEDLSKGRLTWVWVWLSEHPELDSTLYEELRAFASSQVVTSGVPGASGELQVERTEHLRSRCSELIGEAPEIIAQEIERAMAALKDTFPDNGVFTVASAAVDRLKSSYL